MPSRKKPNPGWLRLQRERFGPNYRVPPKNSLHVSGDLVDDVLKKFGLQSSAQLAEIEKHWVDLVGKANAAQSRPGTFERGTLTVYVDHHMWLNEMKRVVAPGLLKKLQAQFGKKKIKSLRFRITPEEEN